MQLVAYGAQDIYLTGNPQITFFKVVYRRHTNFSMETIQQTINGTSTLSGTEGSGSVTISRNGDLVHKVYVSVTNAGVTDGSKIVKSAELEIGGQRIDKHTHAWNEAWNELSTPESKAIGLKSMQSCIGTSADSASSVNQVQVPLNFWFCRNPGLALPLIALQYHEVKVKFVWGTTAGGSGQTCVVMADYIYLDTDERRRFAQVSHEYLIEQLQEQSGTSDSNSKLSMKLNFNHPVKELIWNLPSGVKMNEVVLKLNGHERFSKQSDEYFTLRQPFDYHTAVPRQNLPVDARSQILNGLALSGTSTNQTVALTAADSAGSATQIFINDTTINLHSSAVNALGGTEAIVDGDVIAVVFRVCPVVGSSDSGLTGTTGTGTTIAITTVPSNFVDANGSFIFLGVVASSTAATIVLRDNLVNASSTQTGSTTALGVHDVRTIGVLNAPGGSGTAAIVTIHKLNNNLVSEARTSKSTNRIGVYSFALKPEEHQPSGTCNFSRIDNAILNGETSTASQDVTVYAVNYNVLRIMSGMGGLAYSN